MCVLIFSEPEFYTDRVFIAELPHLERAISSQSDSGSLCLSFWPSRKIRYFVTEAVHGIVTVRLEPGQTS